MDKSNTTVKSTPGPWSVKGTNPPHVYGRDGLDIICQCDSAGEMRRGEESANARLIAAAPDLFQEAQVLRCLATSPRFQRMTVADALAELKNNGYGHDDGAAIALAEGR